MKYREMIERERSRFVCKENAPSYYTVQEAIEKLKSFPPDNLVEVNSCCYDATLVTYVGSVSPDEECGA